MIQMLEKVRNNVTIENQAYVVTITPISNGEGFKTFKGVQVDMNFPDGTHFARDRFASHIDPKIIQSWLLKMHYAEATIQKTLTAFEEWDGDLNFYW